MALEIFSDIPKTFICTGVYTTQGQEFLCVHISLVPQLRWKSELMPYCLLANGFNQRGVILPLGGHWTMSGHRID